MGSDGSLSQAPVDDDDDGGYKLAMSDEDTPDSVYDSADEEGKFDFEQLDGRKYITPADVKVNK